MDDSQQLLADYVKDGSESAFRGLVARYINSVHSTALRLVNGDAQMAEDVTQTVFADLARKARTLPPEVMPGGWLHRDACFVAGKTMRGERRRHFRERQAVAMNIPEDHTAANLGLVAPILDEAINQLEPEDRTAILLRFFDQLEFRAVGERMGSNEDAARMRVSRALDKLHTLLKNRGVAFSAAALGSALAAGFVSAAPLGLAATVAGTALAGTASGGATAGLVKFMTITKLKIAVGSAIAVTALAVPVVVQHQSLAKLREENQTLRQQAAQAAPLQADNQRLSNSVLQSAATPALSQSQLLELASLRNEVGRLRLQSNEVAKELAENRLNGSVNIAGGRRGGAAASGKRVFHHITMVELANFIAGVLQAPVADQTGLKGTYDIEMTPPRGGAVDTRVERVTGILHNELGLQLIPFDGPFTGLEQNYVKETGPNKEINIVVEQDGTFTTSTNVLAGLSATNGAGFAIKLDRSDAPGLKPARGVETSGLPAVFSAKLRLIEIAKIQWALEHRKQNGEQPTWEELQPYLGDLKDFTNAPEGEDIIGAVGQNPRLHTSPDFVAAGNAAPAGPQDRATANQNACISNLRIIDAAKGQWALENHKQNSDTPTMDDIRPYVGRGVSGEVPVCPDGGVYTLGKIGERPTCSIPGHVLQ